jgi:hypothetical protein
VVDQRRRTTRALHPGHARAAGRCGRGSCLYVGDIGDNDAARQTITVYRVGEPAATSAPLRVETFNARYPDGPRDAETLLVSGEGRLYIVSKGSTSPIGLYRFPADLRAGTTVELERVGALQPGTRGKGDWITDGAVSADGTRVVLRMHDELLVHAAAAFFAGRWDTAQAIPVTSVREAQGEGVAIDADGSFFLAGEGGGKSSPGTFAHLRCSLPR